MTVSIFTRQARTLTAVFRIRRVRFKTVFTEVCCGKEPGYINDTMKVTDTFVIY